MEIKSCQGNYEVCIERGIARSAIGQADYIVTDLNIARKYSPLLKGKKVIAIKPGEASKSFAGYKNLALKLEDVEGIMAFGGGVVGDLAGFVASTLKRGVSFVQIPTSLVAMVDSSFGGKNGINLGKRKNYLGTIYSPNLVCIDLNLLKTLPEAEFSNGVAEIIKYGAIKDTFLLERAQRRISKNDEDLEHVISECVFAKKYFVELDEKDKGPRHALNFGHTIGHTLELLYNLPHGQAIAIGMLYEAKLLSFDEIKIRKIINALEANKLPTQLPKNAKIEEIIRLMKHDKKGVLKFACNEFSYQKNAENEEKVRKVLAIPIKKEDYPEEDELLPF